MKLRISFKRVIINQAGAPSFSDLDFISSNPSSVTSLSILLNGVPVVIDNSLQDPFNSDVLLLDIPTTSLDNENNLYIYATYESYNVYHDQTITYEYSKNIKLYGYDLGNNAANISQNQDFIIYFNTTNGSLYQEVPDGSFGPLSYGNAIRIRKPYSNITDIYNNVSSPVNPHIRITRTYIASNTSLRYGEVDKIDDPSTYSINPEVEVEYNAGHCGNYSLYFNQFPGKEVIPNYVFYPKVNVYWEINNQNPDLPDNTTHLLADNRVYTNLDFDEFSIYFVDDQTTYPLSSFRINYELYSHDGQLEEQYQSGDILINSPGIFPYTPINYNHLQSPAYFSFQIPEVGDYTIKTSITFKRLDNTDIFLTEDFINLKGVVWHTFERGDICNEYVIKNHSFDTLSLQVDLLSDQGFGLDSNYTVTSLSEQIISLDKDGIYKFTVSKVGENDKIYIITNYCKLQECVSTIIIDLLTNPMCCDDCAYHNYSKLHTIMSLSLVYFSELNSEYNFNYFYDALSTSKLSELFDRKSVMDRLITYCYNCDTLKISDCNCKD